MMSLWGHRFAQPYLATAALCGFALRAGAEGDPGTAGGAAREVTTPAPALVIWYRASAECPDGFNFLTQLEQRGVHARIANAGDHVDFVVTLGQTASVAFGRLERQTSSGTIAVREVEDPKCDGVARALALTLALSHNPEVPSPGVAAEPSSPTEDGSPAEPPRVQSPSREGAVESSGSERRWGGPRAAAAPATRRPRAPARETAVRVVGFSVGVSDTFAASWQLTGSPFFEVQAPSSFPLPNATFRLGLLAALQPSAPASVWMLGALADGCPVGLVAGRWTLRPCAALTSGIAGASAAGKADLGPWLAADLFGRIALHLGQIGLQAQAGVTLPITRYVVSSSATRTLDSANLAGFAGSIGASYQFE